MPVESEEDVYAWLIRENPAVPRKVYCRGCVTSYLGSGEPNPVSKEMVGDTLFCQNCGADLGNYDRQDETDTNGEQNNDLNT